MLRKTKEEMINFFKFKENEDDRVNVTLLLSFFPPLFLLICQSLLDHKWNSYSFTHGRGGNWGLPLSAVFLLSQPPFN